MWHKFNVVNKQFSQNRKSCRGKLKEQTNHWRSCCQSLIFWQKEFVPCSLSKVFQYLLHFQWKPQHYCLLLVVSLKKEKARCILAISTKGLRSLGEKMVEKISRCSQRSCKKIVKALSDIARYVVSVVLSFFVNVVVL